MKQQWDCNTGCKYQATNNFWLELLLMGSSNKIAEQAIAILNQIKYSSHLVSCHQQYGFGLFEKVNIRRKCRTILVVCVRCTTDESCGVDFTHVPIKCHPVKMC